MCSESSLQHDVDVMMIGDDDFKSLVRMTNIDQTSILLLCLMIALSIDTLQVSQIDWFMYATGGCKPEGMDALMHEKGGFFLADLAGLVARYIIIITALLYFEVHSIILRAFCIPLD